MKKTLILFCALWLIAGCNKADANKNDTVPKAHIAVTFYGFDIFREEMGKIIHPLNDDLRKSGLIFISAQMNPDTGTILIHEKKEPLDFKVLEEVAKTYNMTVDTTKSPVELIPDKTMYDAANAEALEVMNIRLEMMGIKERFKPSSDSDKYTLQRSGWNEIRQVFEFNPTTYINYNKVLSVVAIQGVVGIYQVDNTVSPQDVERGRFAYDSKIMKDHIGKQYLVKAQPLLIADFTDVTITTYDGKPYLVAKLDSRGTELLNKITQEYKGKQIAITLGNQIVTAPNIFSTINNGTINIPVPYGHTAQDLAIVLKSGHYMVKPIVLDVAGEFEYILDKDLFDNGDYVADNGSKASGLVREYYSNGAIEQEFYIREGKREGVSTRYHENGRISMESTFKNNLLNGSMKKYYENGNIEYEMSYLNDELDFSKPVKEYHESGKLAFEAMVDKNLNGTMKYHYENGNRAEVTIKNNKTVSGFCMASGKKTELTNSELLMIDKDGEAIRDLYCGKM